MPYQITLPDGSIGMIDDSVPKDRAMEAAEAAYPDAFPGIGEQLLGAPGELAKGFARGFVDPVSGLLSTGYTGLRAAGMELDPFAETAVGKGLAGVQEYLAPDYGTVSQFAGALGGLGSFLVPGAALAKGLGRTATLGGMATGLGAEEARSRVEQARAEGIEVTPGQEFTSQLGGSVIGLTELAPIERLTGPLQAVLRGVKKSDAEMIAPGLFNSAKRMVETGGIEGLQEGMANIAQDLLAKGVYNPNLDVGESALGDAAMGASVGAFAQGAIELVTKGRRRQLYDTLKAEEDAKARIAEAEKARLAEETARKQTLTNFGVEGQPLLLAAPQGQVTPSRQEKSSLDQYGVEDKDLFEPYGTFTRDELDKDVVKELDKRRKEAGRPKTETFTLQDIADTGVYRGELNRLIAQRSGYTGELKFKPSEVVGLAEQKNIDTSTQGFSDFVGRVTGKKPLPEKTGLGALQGLNDVEIFAVREAINKLPTYEQRKILPAGKAAKIFDDKQATSTLTNIKKTIGQDLGEKGLGETSVLKEIGDFSGLEDVNDQKSLLEKYILDGELERVSTPAFAVLDADGKQISVVGPDAEGRLTDIERRKAQEKAAKTLKPGFAVLDAKGKQVDVDVDQGKAQQKAARIGGTIQETTISGSVKDTTINQIRTPDPINRLIGGFDIRQGTFEDTLIDGYDITTETGEVISKTKSLTDAENRVNRATELRKQRQLQLLDAKQKIQENIAKSEQAMADLEALGKKDSEDFKKIQNSMAAQERNLAKVEQNLIEFGKKVAFKSRYKQQKRTGFTLFEGNKPVGTYNSRQEALEASVVSQPTDRLEAMLEAFPTLSASAKPGMDRADIKKLQQVAASELASRKGEIPSGVGVTVEGDITAAEERLALQGIFSPKIKERVNELDKKLRAALDKLGLKDVRLNIVGAIKGELGDADGVYAARLIKIALDAENPMRVLRHEGIHALKELGAFTPDQWRVLENKAKSEWMAKYNIADPKRYGSLSPEIQLEEAIADAFSDFSQTKPPAGMIGNIFNRLKNFFTALDNGFKGLGFQTADDVFGRVDRGELLPGMGERAAEVEGLQAQRVVAETPERYALKTVQDVIDDGINRLVKSVLQPSVPSGFKSLVNDRMSFRKVDANLEKIEDGIMNRLQGFGMTNSEAFNILYNDIRYVADQKFQEIREQEYQDRLAAAQSPERYSLKRVAPSKVVSSVIEDLGLSDAEVAATSLGLQTGKGGTDAFKQANIGGIKQIIEYLEKRYADSGLAPLDITNEQDRDTLSKLLAAEVLAAVRSGGANIQWYDKVIDQMLGMASLKYPELRTDPNAQAAFRIAISVSSQGQNVEDNLKFGERVYEQFSQNAERGRPRFPEIGTGEAMQAMQKNFQLANKMIDKLGMDDFRKFLETPFTVKELNSVGLKIGGELVDEQVLGSSILGPKIGFGFYSNLSGNFEPVTMDMWFMRTIGRLIGKLRGFDPAKYAKQVQRFRGSFALSDESGVNGIYANEFSQEEINNAIVDEQAMIDLARKVKSKHERDFSKNRDLYDSKQRAKTDFVKSAETIIQSLDKPKDVPASGGERRLLRDVARRMRQKVADVTGQDIPPASLQAIVWYPEQELYKALGAKLRVTSQNYANSMRKLLEGEGFDGDRISESAKLGSRRTRRADAGEIPAGTRPTGRRPSRTLSAKEREDLLKQRFSLREPAKVIYEVAPDPNNVELTERWNALPTEQKTEISKRVGARIVEAALPILKARGRVADQVGSYLDFTNPSFALVLEDGDPIEMSKLLGFALSQDSMMVVSGDSAPGLEQTGGIVINIGDLSFDQVDAIYQQLREIEVNGQKPVGGQTTVDGKMIVLNYSGLPSSDLAQLIDQQLNGQFRVGVGDFFTAFPEKGDYDYASVSNDPAGSAGLIRKRSRDLRTEASRLLNDEINAVPRDGKYSLRGTNTPEFREWFGRSQIVDEQGRPRVMYHGTARDITEFKPKQAGAIFVTEDPRFAEDFSYMSEMWMIDHADQFLSEQEIKKAIAAGVAKMAQGMPKQDQIRMLTQILQFPIDSVVRDPDATEIRNEIAKRLPSKPNILPVYVRAERPFDFENQEHLDDLRSMPGVAVHYQRIRRGEWSSIEEPAVQEAIRDLGFDGFYVKEGGKKNLAVYDPNQLKSVTGNIGTYGQREPSLEEAKQFGLTVEEAKAAQKRGDIRYSLRNTNTPEFKQWFRKSPVVNAVDKPQMMFHGTSLDIEEFIPGQTGAIYVSPDPEFAGTFARYSQEREIRKLGENLDQDLEAKQRILDPIIDEAMANGDLTNRNLPYHRDLAQVGLIKDLDQYSKEYWMNWFLEKPMRDAAHSTGVGPALREALANMLTTGRNVMPLYVNPQKPFDYENNTHVNKVAKLVFEYDPDTYESANPKVQKYQRDTLINGLKAGDWRVLEEPIVQEAIKELGFDAFYVKEQDVKNLGLYKPNQLKSAIGNTGAFSPETGKVRYSLRQTNTPAFKQWFGDSKVVDEADKPLVVYHGTSKFEGYEFKPTKALNPAGNIGGYYFSTLEREADEFAGEKEGSEVIPAFLSISNPYIPGKSPVNDAMRKQYYDEMLYHNRGMSDEKVVEYAKSKMYHLDERGTPLSNAIGNERDGSASAAFQRIIKAGGYDGYHQDTHWVAFEPTQIKSAIGNIGTFDPTKPDIRYSLRQTNTPAFKQWFGKSKVAGSDGKPTVVYTGTSKDVDFSTFKVPKSGVWFTESQEGASQYALENDSMTIKTEDYRTFQEINTASRVIPAYLRIDNPAKLSKEESDSIRYAKNYRKAQGDLFDRLRSRGHDGVEIGDGTWVVLKSPNQIKSAIGNTGEFSSVKSDIRYSLRQQAGQTLGQSYLDTVQRTTTPRVEKGFKDRISEAMSATPFAKFRQMFINKYERIEYYSRELAKKFGDSSLLLADQSAIAAALMSDRAAGVAAESFKSGIPVYAKGYTYVDNMGGKVKGLMEILMPLAQKQDPFVYQMFQDYAARRRGVRLDAQGKVTPFSRQELAQIPAIEKQFPEFKQVFEDYQRYNEGLVRYMRDTGVIDAKAAQEWMRYGDYIPFYRQLEGERTVGPSIFSAISGVKAPKKLKGGDAPLGEFLETVVRNSRAAIEAGMRNVAANRVVTNFQRLNSPTAGGKLVERTTEKERDFPDVVTVRENGKDAYYKVADPLLVQSLQALNIPQIPGLDILAKPAEFLREMVTRDPAFIGASVLRESLSAWITTGQKLTPVASGVNQFVKILANASPTVQALRRAGIGSGYEFKGDVQATAGVFGDQLKRMAGEMTTAQKAVMPLRAMWDGLDKASTAADLSTRAAVFERVLEETGNEAEAIYQAMEVINFSRKGSSPIIQIFAAIIPFLNARIQGLDLLYRAGFGRLASSTAVAQQKAFMLRSLALFGTTAMYYALVQDEEEWQRADQETRDNYWIIGGFKFPIPFELGVMFKVIPERIMAYTMGDDTGEQVRESIARQVMGTLSFNPIPQAVLPLIEASSNYSFFLQRDIVGMGKKDLAPEFQISEGTSQIAIQLGQTLGISPMKIDYIIRGYTGAMGTYAITTMDSIIRSEDDATKATWRLDQIPVLKRFMISDLGAGTVNEYYDLREKLDEVVRTSNQLERTGNIEALTEYLKENGQVLGMKDYIRDLDKDMKSLRESRLAINISKMEPDQKRQSLDALRKAEIALTERINLLRKNMGV
jgi:hypothetical protein